LTEDQKTPADLELDLEAPEVEFRHLISAGSVFAALINEVTRAYTQASHDQIKWIIEIKPGSVRVPLRGRPANGEFVSGSITELAAAITDGMATLDERAERPRFFTDQALVQARALANLATDELPISVRRGRRKVPLSKRALPNIDRVIGKQQTSYGTVEGKLEGLQLHGPKPQFAVYEPLTGHKVECHFTEDVTLDDLRPAIGRRVGVRGQIRSTAEGVRMSVDAHELRIFPDDADLPTAEDVLGILAGYE
jgi:hypothetical protein